MSLLEAPGIQNILAGSKALTAALSCVEGEEDSKQAKELVLKVFANHETPDMDSWVEHCAMASILDIPQILPRFKPIQDPPERLIFETTALVWMSWVLNLRHTKEHKALLNLKVPSGSKNGGALQLMALQPWTRAIKALIQGNSTEAQRFFRRTTELGSQFGTETNTAIQWTYAASFFPT
jgi:hypothetical protein